MKLRHIDPAVWAAAYAAAFVQINTIYDIKHGIDDETPRAIADAAVRALHPEADGPDEPTPWAPAKLPEAAPIPRVPDPAPTWLRVILDTPAARLAHLEAAERAVLLAAGWTPATDPAGAWIDPVTHDWQPTRDAIGIQRDRDHDRVPG